jgi:hypothetical protein
VGEAPTPGERLLEVVVFAPAGLAVTVVEEFPKLVEKGRHRLEGQVHTARLVGQFAVQMGRRQLDQALSRFGDKSTGTGTPAGPGAASPGSAPPRRAARPGESTPDGSPPDDGTAPLDPDAGLFVRSVADGDAAAALAIPNYDSLSAPQVVQRLDGLSPAELRDVRAHESAHRRRRTILHRVEQILDGRDVSQP